MGDGISVRLLSLLRRVYKEEQMKQDYHYHLIYHDSLGVFEREVNEYLEKGYELVGQPFITPGDFQEFKLPLLTQAVIHKRFG